MLFRPYLVVLGCAGALMAAAAVPAVAASPAPTTTTPSPTPAIVAVQCPPPSVVLKDGKTVRIPTTAVPAVPNRAAAPSCRQFLKRVTNAPMPKGAPETGGGGMATVVAAWG